MRKQTFESTTTPGASYTLKTIGRQMRHRVELELAEVRHKQRMVLQEQFSIVPEEFRVSEEKLKEKIDSLPKEDTDRLGRLSISRDLLLDEVRFAFLRTMLDGFTIPGEEYSDVKTTEDLLEFGPESFTDEVLLKAESLWGLTPDEAKNSSRPTTSPEQVDGPTTDTVATSASSVETTELAIAS